MLYFYFHIYRNKLKTEKDEVVYEDFTEVEVLDETLESAKRQAVNILGDKFTDYKFVIKKIVVQTDKN